MAAESSQVLASLEANKAIDSKVGDESSQIFTLDTPEFVLLNIPSGKPNRHYEPKALHSPLRVTQKPTKGQTCYYYAMKTAAILEKDYLEKQGNFLRKAASQQYRKKMLPLVYFDFLKIWLSAYPEEHLNKSKKDLLDFLKFQVQFLTKNPKHLGAVFPNAIENKAQILSMFEEVLAEYARIPQGNIFVALMNCEFRPKIKICEEFLRFIGLDPAVACQPIIDKINQKLAIVGGGYNYRHLEEADTFTKAHFLTCACDFEMAKIYGFSYIPWTPTDKIDVLFDLIKQNESPVLMGGHLGKAFYKLPPMASKGVGHYDNFVFVIGSHKGPKTGPTHAISIIGIEKNQDPSKPGVGWIYYIDPGDGSEPLAKRKIYKMSYEQLCELSVDNHTLGAYTSRFPAIRHLKDMDYGLQKLKEKPAAKLQA